MQKVLDHFGKAETYYTQDRADLRELIPRDVRSILDVGCGAGQTWADRPSQIERIAGIERSAEAAAKAARILDDVIVGDVDMGLDKLEGQRFDLIWCADILEHLMDPWATLRRLTGLMSPSGTLIASIPNITYFKVLRGLKRGRFEYKDRGILDRDHLRFFTRSTVIGLAEQARLRVIKLDGRVSANALRRVLYRLAGRTVADRLIRQWYLVASIAP